MKPIFNLLLVLCRRLLPQEGRVNDSTLLLPQ